MAFDIPIYRVVMGDESDEIDFNSVVDYPAHSKAFHLFEPTEKRVFESFNDEKMIVTGVAVATEVPIYRIDPEGREYYLYFTEEETRKFAQRLFERGYMNNVNEMHDSNRTVSGMKLIESYFVSDNHPAPEMFKDQNLKKGSWIVSYQVTDPETWSKLKSGVYAGFSVEGWFTLVRANFKNQNKMVEKEEKGFFAKIKDLLNATNEEEPIQNEPEVFGEAITTDGATIVWDGESLEVGMELRLRGEEGSEILAPEGVHSVLNEDGSTWVITVDANGIVSELETVEAEGEMEQAVEEMAKVIAELRSENEELKKTVEDFETFKTETNEKIETLSEVIDKFDQVKAKKKDATPTWKEFTK